MSDACRGLLVIAIEQAVAAPFCTMRLADAGARVIKIERSEGETARHYDGTVHGTSAYFAWLNRGKESVTLDLKVEADRMLAHRMAARADIFVQNLAPGASERLGLGSADLVQRYPRLVAVDIVGYRQTTPAKNKRAYDMLVQAESGLCSVTGTAATPVKVGVSIADIGTGMNAHAAVLEALYVRERTGKGRAIEVAMFDSMAEWMTVPFLHFEQAGRRTPRTGLAHASIFPYHVTRCLDGELMIAVQNPAEWRRFCSGVLEDPAVESDPRFSNNTLRVKNRDPLIQVINAVFRQRTRLEMIRRLDSYQLAWANVSSAEDLGGHPALTRMKASVGKCQFELPISPLAPDLGERAVPGLGEHTHNVSKEFGNDAQ